MHLQVTAFSWHIGQTVSFWLVTAQPADWAEMWTTGNYFCVYDKEHYDRELTHVPVFSEAQCMPRIEAENITADSNWTRTDVEPKFNTAVRQAQRHKVTSSFILAIVQNQTWTNRK